MHIASNHASAHDTIKVQEVMRGIANDQRKRPKQQARPTSADDIGRMIDALPTNTNKGSRDRALILMGFDGALRRSELVGIQLEDIDRREDGLLVEIPFSKTDQAGKGQTIAIVRRSGSPYCPVKAYDDWLTRSSCKNGYIFKSMCRGDKVGYKSLSAQSVALIIKEAIVAAAFPPGTEKSFSGHSLRRGVITEVARAGASIADILYLSRHKSAGSAIEYIDRETKIAEHPTRNIPM